MRTFSELLLTMRKPRTQSNDEKFLTSFYLNDSLFTLTIACTSS